MDYVIAARASPRAGLRAASAALTALLLLLAGLPPTSAQYASPYDLSLGRGLAVGGAGAIAGGVGTLFSRRMEPLSEAEVAALDRGDVWALDRLATRKRSPVALVISDVTGYGATALPLSLLGSDRVRDNAADPGLLYVQAMLLNGGITHLVKNTARRPRPYTRNPLVPLAQKRVKDARRSFFSGHTSNAAVNAFFTAQVYSDFYPDREQRGWVWVSAALLPAVTGTTRVLSGNHYWTDVLVGYVVGAGIGVLVPRLHRL